MHRSNAGFTIIELVVVIVILGLLVTIVGPRAIDALRKAFQDKAEIDILAIDSALQEYAISNNTRYPESLEELVTPDENGYRFLKQMKVPVDPWGNEYGYEPPGSGRPDPRIFTLGRDGAPGGDGEDTDISNITLRGGEE